MRNDTIWLISGGHMQEHACETIKEMGFKLILSDGNPECFCKKYADLFLHIDTFDSNHHMMMAESVKLLFDIKLIFTCAADCHETVAILSEYLGLPSHSSRLSRICRNKYLFRNRLRFLGVGDEGYFGERLVNSFFCKSYEDVTKLNMNYKVCLKADENSGSRGFQVFDSVKDITKDDFEYTLGYSKDGAIVETYIQPRLDRIAEFSVETYWDGNELNYINIVDRIYIRDLKHLGYDKLTDFYWDLEDKDGIEIGHINNATQFTEIDQLDRIIKQLPGALQLYREHPFILKLDLMIDEDGQLHVLEVTPRLSGGYDSPLSSPLRGGNITSAAINLGLYGKASFRYIHPQNKVVVLSKVYPNANDCIGRRFAYGMDKSLDNAIDYAIRNLMYEDYIN
jgi:hypothetical protein